MDEREAPGSSGNRAGREYRNASGGGKNWRTLSVLSLVSNVMVLVIGGPMMGWVCGRLSDAYSRADVSLPAPTVWFMRLSWTKMTVGGLVLAALLIVMERKVKRPGVTFTVHIIVTVALSVLIGAFIYAMLLPMIRMVDMTGES